MPVLPTELRNLLERTVINARDEAEKAAKASLVRLAVHQAEPYPTLSSEERSLRNRLRTEARRLGESTTAQSRDRDEPFALLVAEVAYAQWHRMLFARFLAENNMLMHPQGVAVTLDECVELAAEENEPDAWMLAARYASAMLPGIFLQDDPSTQVRFDAAGRLALERFLNDLPGTVFKADDSLGWVYQFWQTKRKKEVAESGVKIGGADISPVTQLFTEHYMVQFLLHNSLGAWWTARHTGKALPTDLEYLRRSEDGTAAAGEFSSWPGRAAELRVLDPCCGSGHFLVAAFALLCRFRMIEEGLSACEAGDAVLRDNLFGLEIDPRCAQIAAFSVALAAWKAGGYRELPIPNIACTGLPVGENVYEFTHLADGDVDMEATLRQLHYLFRQAPDLGSLIDPERVAREHGTAGFMDSMFASRWDDIAERLDRALAIERDDDPASSIFGATAKGVARAADLLTKQYHLVATNVPYLARGKQDATLCQHIETYYSDGKADLATAFVDRCLRFCTAGGTVALVTPQNWMFLGAYKKLRERLLKEKTWNFVVKLGMAAFSDMYWWAFNTGLFVISDQPPHAGHTFAGLDASAARIPFEKAKLLAGNPVHVICQSAQLNNPDARITLEDIVGSTLLGTYANCLAGLSGADITRFTRTFWEAGTISDDWEFLQNSFVTPEDYTGMSDIVLWEGGRGSYYRLVADKLGERGVGAWIRGTAAWGKRGVAVVKMGSLCTTLYLGNKYGSNIYVIVPTNEDHLPAIYAFTRSAEFVKSCRALDQKIDIANHTILKVPFDLSRWQQIASTQYPNGLPEPYSDDPTQWLFHGHPVRSDSPLHVAVCRLLDYRWPRQQGIDVSSMPVISPDGIEKFGDDDGVVCIPAVVGQQQASQRLREVLAIAFGPSWSTNAEDRLLASSDYVGRGLDEWLRDGFFAQHCRLFHNRPFLWHIWDGRKDGFSAIVNYHKLDRSRLDRLIYTYLGDWINTQRHADSSGVAGANARLVAAITLQGKLKAIADGEPPFDIYVRWKSIRQQPIGWEPDLNDGVRVNIRPFVTAGVLRAKFSINWNKDRGINPDGSERLNDLHLTRAEKVNERAITNTQ